MHIVGGRIANDDEVFAVNRLEGPENLFALALPSGDGVPGSVSGLNGDPVDDEQHDQTRQENPYGTAVDLCLAQVADGLNTTASAIRRRTLVWLASEVGSAPPAVAQATKTANPTRAVPVIAH